MRVLFGCVIVVDGNTYCVLWSGGWQSWQIVIDCDRSVGRYSSKVARSSLHGRVFAKRSWTALQESVGVGASENSARGGIITEKKRKLGGGGGYVRAGVVEALDVDQSIVWIQSRMDNCQMIYPNCLPQATHLPARVTDDGEPDGSRLSLYISHGAVARCVYCH
jgi:hypothetical protein